MTKFQDMTLTNLSISLAATTYALLPVLSLDRKMSKNLIDNLPLDAACDADAMMMRETMTSEKP